MDQDTTNQDLTRGGLSLKVKKKTKLPAEVMEWQDGNKQQQVVKQPGRDNDITSCHKIHSWPKDESSPPNSSTRPTTPPPAKETVTPTLSSSSLNNDGLQRNQHNGSNITVPQTLSPSGRVRDITGKNSFSPFKDIGDLGGLCTTPGLLPLQLGAEVNPLRKEGFHYTLDAPTSGMVRRGEDTLTYLNKDQFYPLTFEFVPTPSRPSAHWPDGDGGADDQVMSVVMLQFRERKMPQEALAHWEFWHARQHSPQMRLLDVELQNKAESSKDDRNSKIDVDEIAHNAVEVKWCPKNGPATVAVAIHCLSTDFSSQKGVKGIPLHIQIDTYKNKDSRTVSDRAFLQIKTFCDKGAERKAREEERRLYKQGSVDTASTYLTPIQHHSTFQKAFDLMADPILYAPKVSSSSTASSVTSSENKMDCQLQSQSSSISELPFPLKDALMLSPMSKARSAGSGGVGITPEVAKAIVGAGGATKTDSSPKIKKKTVQPSKFKRHPNNQRVLVYAKQDNEEVYMPLHISPPTVQGLIRAISAKYQIDSVDIRFAFRETNKGIVVKIDDDMIKYYCNGDTFIMKVLATEETASGHVFYDVIFADPPVAAITTATENAAPKEVADNSKSSNENAAGDANQSS